MRIGLIDVDGHNFPNLALMRISAYHKSRGDLVEWWWSDFVHYDLVYMSKVFSDAYSPDIPAPINADKVLRGGTGYAIHLVDDADLADLEQMRLKDVHFAWDNPRADLAKKFADYARVGKKNKHGRFGTVYILTNFGSTMEENLHRVYTVRDLGYDPYVMIYNKPSAPREVKRLQRWVNNKIIFKSVKKFEEFLG